MNIRVPSSVCCMKTDVDISNNIYLKCPSGADKKAGILFFQVVVV